MIKSTIKIPHKKMFIKLQLDSQSLVLYKALMLRLWPMAKLVQAKLLQWKDLNIIPWTPNAVLYQELLKKSLDIYKIVQMKK